MKPQRIRDTFAALRAERRSALVIYLTVGDPSVADSLACAEAALDAGADMLELGVPFSDPTADGPVIAAASHRAIKSGGSLRAALTLAKQLRERGRQAPLVLFSYVNPIVAFGEAELPAALLDAGVDGVLVVDLPPEEGSTLRDNARSSGIAVIPLIAPTTPAERQRSIAAGASGFIYYVSLTGVTGSAAAPLEAAADSALALREQSGVPVVVGFGIDTAEKAARVAARGVDGVVVGTAVVRAIAAGTTTAERVESVRSLVAALRAGLDSSSASA